MFAYCGNNPVSRSDETGDFWNFIVGAIVGAVVNAVTTVVEAVQEGGLSALGDGKTWAKVGVSFAVGAVEGAVAATPLGSVGQSIVGAMTSGFENACHQAIDKGGFENVDCGEVIFNAAIGGFSARKNGISNGTAAHLKAQERSLMNSSKPFGKRIEYYYSQTATSFYRPLLQHAKQDLLNNLKTNFVVGTLRSCATSAQ